VNPAHSVETAFELVEKIKPLLCGVGPDVQGAALAELLSLFLAGHAPEVRARVLELHLDVVRDLTEINARRTWGR
jgi:hypothetical protein